MSPKIAIIESGGANIASLLCAIDRLGCTASLTRDAEAIQAADRVLLPGVGAARDAMQRLRAHGLVDVIRNLQQPVLGICLGMQLLAEGSEEDGAECLGILPGAAKRLPADSANPVPNMGWCELELTRQHDVLRNISSGDYVYFLHSFALPVGELTLASASHAEPFSAVVARDNFVGAQFHPERSSRAGARLLKNFLEADQ